MVTTIDVLPPCARCGSKAVAAGPDSRGHRVLCCSSCGKRARLMDPPPVRSSQPPEGAYWLKD